MNPLIKSLKEAFVCTAMLAIGCLFLYFLGEALKFIIAFFELSPNGSLALVGLVYIFISTALIFFIVNIFTES